MNSIKINILCDDTKLMDSGCSTAKIGKILINCELFCEESSGTALKDPFAISQGIYERNMSRILRILSDNTEGGSKGESKNPNT